MKKLNLLRRLLFVIPLLGLLLAANAQSENCGLFENFETSFTNPGYSGSTVTIGTNSWYIAGYCLMGDNDHYNGTTSVRLRGNQATDAHTIRMEFDKPNGLGTLSFAYASYGSHSGGNLIVSYSTDSGNSWIQAGTITGIPSWSGSMLTASFSLNILGNVRIKIDKEVQSGSTSVNIDDICLTDFTNSNMVATPIFSPISGTLYTPQNITISCSTPGATIYYTTDNSEPTTASSIYTAPILVSASTTIKAKAHAPGMDMSSTATATYIFPINVATIADFIAANTTTNSTPYHITNDLTFVFRNGSNMYVKDTTGGLLIYDPSTIITSTYNEGDIISGGIIGSFSLYNGLTELIPLVNTAVSTQNSGTVSPIIATVDDINNNYDYYESQLVTIQDVVFTTGGSFTSGTASNITFTQNLSTMTCRSNFKNIDLTIPANYNADVTGFISAYNTQYQIFPRGNQDIIAHVTEVNPELIVTTPYEGQVFTTLDTLFIGLQINNFTLGTDGFLKVESPLLPLLNMPNPSYLNAGLVYLFMQTPFFPPVGNYSATLSLVTMNYAPLSTPVSVTRSFSVIQPTVEQPTITPICGTYYEPFYATINCATPGTTIYYTTDGTAPTINSTEYTQPIYVNQDVTIKCIAVKNGWNDSPIKVAVYQVQYDPILVATPTTLNFTENSTTQIFTVSGFYLDSAIELSVNNPLFTLSHSQLAANSNNDTITVTFTGTESTTGLISISSDTLSIVVNLIATTTVATPTFTPTSTSSNAPITVAIATTTAGAAIYYTTDGSTPDENSNLYSSPLLIASTTTLKAIATKSNWNNSAIAESTYTIYTPSITTDPTSLSFTDINNVQTLAVTGSHIDTTIGISCNNNNFSFSPATLPSTGGTVTITFNGTTDTNATLSFFPINNMNNVMASVNLSASIYVPSIDTIIYQVGFESIEGFVATNVYNNTAVAFTGNVGQQWGTFFGTPSTTSPISGSQSMQMRYYTSTPTSLGYTYTNFDLPNVTKIEFLAANTNNLNLNVSYSTDGGQTFTGTTLYELSSEEEMFTYNISATGNYDNVRIKFEISLPTTAPTSTSRVYLDSIIVFGIPNVEPSTVSTPTITPTPGNYFEPQAITIECTTADAIIRYTTDGTTPTATSTEYTAPFTINSTTTINAKAWKSGLTESNMATATYLYPIDVTDIAAFKTASSATNATVYRITGDVTFIGRFGANIYLKDNSGGLLIYDNGNVITTEFNEGDVISGGVCGTFTLYNQLIEMIPVLNLNSSTVNTGTVMPIEATIAQIEADYDLYCSQLVKIIGVTFEEGSFNTTSATNVNFSQDGNTMVCRNQFKTVSMTIPNGYHADITGFILRYNSNYQIAPRSNDDIEEIVLEQVATPTFTPEGENITIPWDETITTISIACTTPDATIYYTLDETTPNENSLLYTEPIALEIGNHTIKAIAFKENMTASEVATAHYAITTGIESFQNLIAIYPNPVQDKLTLYLDQVSAQKGEIISANGQILSSFIPNNNIIEIPFNQYANGIYFIQITTQQGIIIKKVIKQ